MRYFKVAFISLFFPFFLRGNQVPVVNVEQLQTYAAHKNNDTLYIMNFWATWCDPCVKELPVFQQEYKKYSRHKVKMIFVSLNSLKEIGKVQSFVNEHIPESLVLLLNGGNPNDWIDKIDSSWSGTLPATVMYKFGEKVYFREGDFTSESLGKVIQSKSK